MKREPQFYKDEVAKENGYENWGKLLMQVAKEQISVTSAMNLEDKAMKRYGEDMCKEQIKLCADALDIGYEDDLHKQQVLNCPLATDN